MQHTRRPRLARRYGSVNWRGLWVLYSRKAVLRFLRYGLESIAGPVVSSCIFVTVFVLALGGGAPMSPDLTLAQFVIPGIAMFTLAQVAFDSAAVMIIHDKQEGIIEDVLMAPLTPFEITLGYCLGAATNGLITGGVLMAIFAIFIDLPFSDPMMAVGFAFGGTVLFSLVGVIVGIWAERWDHFSAAETFLVMPLGLLSGTFFSIDRVPDGYDWLLLGNPMFHAINGFRTALTGHSDASVLAGGLFIAGLAGLLALLAWRLFAIGYRIKA
ncbi:ABC transporter permease [Pelagibius sp. Alg239-R121]|uniref:ABC transporter permease n=1 Tax=Pelagibius sp. Alg239-R121 TaxID=2993448 RepID=UPI0024A67A59|nr:ABC transporter permease [Pelagibius sp. Alg239-R121]